MLAPATPEPVTQPRGATSFKGKNRLKEEDGKEHNEGRKNKKIPNQISGHSASSPDCTQEHNPPFALPASHRHQVENYKYYSNYASFPLP